MENYTKIPPQNIEGLKNLPEREIIELTRDIYVKLTKVYRTHHEIYSKVFEYSKNIEKSIDKSINIELTALHEILNSKEEILRTSLDLLSKSYNFERAESLAITFHNTEDILLRELANGGLYQGSFSIAKLEGPAYILKRIPEQNAYKDVRQRYLDKYEIQEPIEAIETFEQFRKEDPEIAGLAFLFNFNDFVATNKAIETIKK